MKIGTDVSIAECRREGYLVMEFEVKKLFPKGRKKPMDKTAAVNFTYSNPHRWNDSGKPMPGIPRDELFYLDTWLSYGDLLELYIPHKDEIDQCTGNYGEERIDYLTIEPTEYDLLSLADMVKAYRGLE
jgi:hypothetical protein